MTFDSEQEKAELVAILGGATYTVTGASACALADRIRAVQAAPVVAFSEAELVLLERMAQERDQPPPAVDG